MSRGGGGLADVFISYARSDEAVARRVAKALQASGLSVWWDADLPAHRAYSDVIERNLEQAKAVVVLWSKTAAASQWVRAEADVARNAGKLVQGQLDGTLPPMPFNQIQSANLKGWRGSSAHAGWAKLNASAHSLVSGEEPPTAARAKPRARDRLAPFLWPAGALLSLVLAAGIYLYAFGFPGEQRKPVLAVLPFRSLDAQDASLVAGMWEDTRSAIGRNPQLIVLGPNSAQQLADKGEGAAKRAADYVLEASVRTAGDRIRVSADLVRTKDGEQLWSQDFDRKLDDVFALQSEIASDIEGYIRGRLAEKGGTLPEHIATTGEVYALYSDARAKLRSRSLDNYSPVRSQLQQVLKMDPNFAPAWATMAVVTSFGQEESDPPLPTAEAEARRAVALAPNLGAAHAALGFVLRRGPVAQAELRRAIALDPSDYEARNWLAGTLGNDEPSRKEKLDLFSQIVEIEPLWWPAIINQMNLLFEIGDPKLIQQQLDRITRQGDARLTAAVRMSIDTNGGNLAQAVNEGLAAYLQASPSDRPFLENFLFQPLIQLGLFDAVDKISGGQPHGYIRYIRSNDPKAIPLIEAAHKPGEFWKFGPLPIVGGRVYLTNGQGARLAERYHEAAKSPEDFEELIGKDEMPSVAPIAALALRSTGEEAEATRLLQLAEADMQVIEEQENTKAVLRARIYAVQGRTSEGMELLSSAVRRGWLPNWLPFHTDIAMDPPLAELRKDPRFEAIRQQILGKLARERAQVNMRLVDQASAA